MTINEFFENRSLDFSDINCLKIQYMVSEVQKNYRQHNILKTILDKHNILCYYISVSTRCLCYEFARGVPESFKNALRVLDVVFEFKANR